jgi:hypothetical protein
MPSRTTISYGPSRIVGVDDVQALREELTMEDLLKTPFLDGLLNYEIILLYMGLVLFAVGILALLLAVVFNRTYRGALGVVLLSLIFVGYPSVQGLSVKTEFGDLVAQLNHEKGHPVTQAQKDATAETINKLTPRARTPQQKAILAEAWRDIGDQQKAFDLANEVNLTTAPVAVRDVVTPILTSELKNEVADASISSTPRIAANIDTSKVQNLVSKLDNPSLSLSADEHATLAAGNVALGNDRAATINVRNAQALNRDVTINHQVLQRAVKSEAVQRANQAPSIAH